MKVLIACDKFKGSLSAMKVCESIQLGISISDPDMECIIHPLADGGDGSLDVLTNHLDLQEVALSVQDPLGREIISSYYVSDDNAFIELASATGLVLLQENDRNPLYTTTLGTGEMIVHAIKNKGLRKIFLFLGGSSTTDAGIGIAHALGFRFLDINSVALNPIGENLINIKQIDSSNVINLQDVRFHILCDVENPMFGKNGAAFVYAKQKGASDEEINLLDQGLRNFALIIKEYNGNDIGAIPGGGTAGGISAGLSGLLKVDLKKGFDTIVDFTDFESKLAESDIVITGEGRLDSSSLQGKVISGVSKLCKKHNKPLYVFVGQNKLTKDQIVSANIQKVYAVTDLTNDVKDAIDNSADYLKQLASRF